MITMKLWQRLRKVPASNPFYNRTLKEQVLDEETRLAGITCIGLVLLPLLCIITVIFIFIDILLMLLFPISLAIWWSIGETVVIGRIIAKSRLRSRFELESLYPDGALGICTAIATGVIFRQNHTDENWQIHAAITLCTSLCCLLVGCFLLFAVGQGNSQSIRFSEQTEPVIEAVRTITIPLAAFFGLMLHFVTSKVIAFLGGTWAGLVTTKSSEVTAVALGITLSIQITIFLLTTLAAQSLALMLPMGAEYPVLAQICSEIVLVGASLGVFTVLCLSSNWLLWRVVCAQLDIAPDIDALTEQPL